MTLYKSFRVALACSVLAVPVAACAQAGGGANAAGAISASAPVRTQQGLVQ